MRCLHCELPVKTVAGVVYVDGTGTTADGLTYCPPDPDRDPGDGVHLARLCAGHGDTVRRWQGTSCGEAGWGPGHRIPPGLTMALVDETVALMRGACAEGRGCSDVQPEPTCHSRDRHGV